MYFGQYNDHNGLRNSTIPKNRERYHPPPDYGNFPDKNENLTRQSNESLDSTGKTKSFKRLVERFAEKTSMQGVAYINGAKVWYARIIWTFLLIGCSVGMALHLYYLISQFLKWPVQTKIELGFDNLPFPAVTICNINPVRRSQLNLASERFQSFVEEMDVFNEFSDTNDVSTETPSVSRRKRFVNDFSKINTSNFEEDIDDDYDDEFEYGSAKDERTAIVNIFRNLYLDEPRDERQEMGHQLEDMMLSCTIGKYKCFASNFSLIQHKIYGNCYTFNTSNLLISKSGPDFGLSLILYMDKEDYLKQLNEGYGARLLIHDSNTYPYPFSDGLFVPSSSETQVGLKMVTINRKDFPYGNCTEDIYFRRYGFKYTRAFCQTLCSQERLFQTCGCYEDDATEIFYQIKTTNLKFCESANERRCMSRELARQDLDKAACKCQNPCRESQFVKTLSSRNWPSEDYMSILKEGVCDRLPRQCNAATQDFNQNDLFRKGLNYVKINIFYEDLNYEIVTEEPEIENAQFASDFGGAVGLWIGLSFLSMFEVFQLLVECFAFGAHKLQRGNRKNNDQKKKKNTRSNAPNNIYFTGIKDKQTSSNEIIGQRPNSNKRNIGNQVERSMYDNIDYQI